ncbi:hypothetical protein [Agromyces sp. NBRC 114283]|uniref:hypothetical protein n=1 Tax=Agromyces sp. NBRC 114283 TaxID=2994521 RepID=UPI002552AC80|nr:hypothetical protein [Agromyces sp. NBRC 114283]
MRVMSRLIQSQMCRPFEHDEHTQRAASATLAPFHVGFRGEVVRQRVELPVRPADDPRHRFVEASQRVRHVLHCDGVERVREYLEALHAWVGESQRVADLHVLATDDRNAIDHRSLPSTSGSGTPPLHIEHTRTGFDIRDQ